MVGVITAKHVLTHCVIIVTGFGFGCFVRCLYHAALRHKLTFLQIAMGA